MVNNFYSGGQSLRVLEQGLTALYACWNVLFVNHFSRGQRMPDQHFVNVHRFCMVVRSGLEHDGSPPLVGNVLNQHTIEIVGDSLNLDSAESSHDIPGVKVAGVGGKWRADGGCCVQIEHILLSIATE
ncbi:hypothetical protein BMS3Bbin04_01022 [bacterium BMS3Bbin04]|nr:hypothetical protein BMS3Bbin04_01022 [bacterium BMS3Bbin04]